AAGRVSTLWHKSALGTVLLGLTYTYDLAGRLTGETADGASTTYAYDAAGQLTRVNGASPLTYDGAGNPTSNYSVGSGNRVVADGSWTYTYDAEGDLVQKQAADGHGGLTTLTYGYDGHDRMTSAEEHYGNGTLGDVLEWRLSFRYDVFGRRIEEDV